MQFSELQSTFAEFRGDPSDQRHGEDDDKRYINFAYKKIARSAEWPWLEAVDETLDSVAGQAEYDIPSTIKHPRVVRVDTRICHPTTFNQVHEWNDYRASGSFQSGDPTHYYLKGNGAAKKIGFYPTPASSGTNNIYTEGLKPVVSLSEDSDYPLFQTEDGDEHLEVLLFGAFYFYTIKDDPDNTKLINSREQRFKELIKEMKAEELPSYSARSPIKAKMIIDRRKYPPQGNIPHTEI